MGFGRLLRFHLALAASLAAVLPGGTATAVTGFGPPANPFLFDITTFTTTLALPVRDEVETVKMPPEIMRQRLELSGDDETVEPLSVQLRDDDAEIAQMAEKIALNGKEDLLAGYLRHELREVKTAKKDDPTKTVELDEDAFKLVDKDAFADLYSKPHHNLAVDTSTLRKDKALRRDFLRQIGSFFSKGERQVLQNKIDKGDELQVNTDLLPEFPRKMLKKYIVYRGPNCFHAALAFHSPKLTSSSLINVKIESGYHRSMINYDELWRVLGVEFYEVNPDKQPLKYGDMIVLFDVPKAAAEAPGTAIDFRWIRHTATYLFSGYTFSKGSKSANTPYTVRTLAEEWRTWKRYTKNLGVKVYRRSTKAAQPKPPIDLTDWIY